MIDFISHLIGGAGALGVFILMLIENVFPPIPSELILPFAGYAAARGELSFGAAVFAGTVGSVAGSWVWFEAGRRLGEARLLAWAGRHGRWLALHPGELEKALSWLRRRGAAAVLVGRMLPGVRGVICLPAGFAGLGRRTFLIWCTLGSFGWTLLLCGAGFQLAEHYAAVEGWIAPVTYAIVAVFAGFYIFRLATWPNAPRRRSGRGQLGKLTRRSPDRSRRRP